ncbi:SMP-30/gluconolactonase/LRE family protein [Streptomyces cyaneofuscatus]|uniref:SMP-30/gluconolactonase/LRE family protein n=1 Tax=Streptomyces cyaneofuscatus TaxID=66883 RepID=UPI003805C369
MPGGSPHGAPDGSSSDGLIRTRLPRARLGEGPRYDAATATLSWVDIVAGQVWLADVALGGPAEGWPKDPRPLVGLPGSVSCAVRAGEADEWLLANGGTVVRWRPGTEPVPLVQLEPDARRAHLNDGAVDAEGRFWVGSMGVERPLRPWGRVRVIDAGQAPPTATVAVEGLLAANGIGWSPDGTRVYVVDSGRRLIHRLRYGADGVPTPDGPPLEPAGGVPDGIAVDDEGCLWVALWDGGRVVRLSPGGEELGRIGLPCSRPTACALVGTRLVVTTAQVPGEDASGWTYATDVEVGGPAAHRAALV